MERRSLKTVDGAKILPRQGQASRRPGSIRRTTNLDMRWALEPEVSLTLFGHGRDLLTTSGGHSVELDETRVEIEVEPLSRQVLRAEVDGSSVDGLVGVSGGRGFRKLAAEYRSEDYARASLTATLLDDVPISFIARSALIGWPIHGSHPVESHGSFQRVANTCAGFAPGSPALQPGNEGLPRPIVISPATSGARGDWHRVRTPDGPTVRRSRQLDVWESGGLVWAEEWFQDAAYRPDGTWEGVHEYTVHMSVDRTTTEVVDVGVEPHVLPQLECPTALLNVGRVRGMTLETLNRSVAKALPGVDGCTHLNDTLRSFSALRFLVEAL